MISNTPITTGLTPIIADLTPNYYLHVYYIQTTSNWEIFLRDTRDLIARHLPKND